jgi:isopropylmalate/homocitrate/citramalate synthase
MEANIVSDVAVHAKKNRFNIRTAALGRAFLPDAKILCDTKIDDIHLHLHLKDKITPEELTLLFKTLESTISLVRTRRPEAMISVAMLDIGKTDPGLLDKSVKFLTRNLGVDILSLPDTSGIMAPNQVHDKIKEIACAHPGTKLSIHCHNDMGMASANSIMGILAGACVLEVSALGLGERNGIGDLFTTAKHLKDQGMDLKIDTDNLDLFKKYYEYLDDIVRQQTGQRLIQYNTPVFGEAVKTHVAGTHAREKFGTQSEENFYLNLLCGKGLVQKYLSQNKIPHEKNNQNKIDDITAAVKTQSITMGRRLTKDEVKAIVLSLP